jgi:hypothetical protein
MTNYETVMYGFTYDRLKHITEIEKPYRGSTNRYPFRYRKQSTKYFLVEVVDGKTEYHVVYGRKWFETEITKEEHDKAHALKNGEEWRYRIRDGKYLKQDHAPDVILVVRDDNTVEFTADHLHQGTRHFLTQNVRGWFEANRKLGGVVYRQSRYSSGSVTTPIFKGLRADAQTMRMHKDSEYEVRLPRVDRKKSMQAMTKYKTPFTIAKTMLSIMDFDAFCHELKGAKEDMDSAFEGANIWTKGVREQMQEYALTYMDSDPLRSVSLSMIAFDIYHARSISSGWSKGFSETHNQMTMYTAVFTKMKNQTYIKEDTFNYDVIKSGESLTSCGWKAKLFVNGKETNQY